MSSVFVVSGLSCFALSIFIFYSCRPRPGKPPSPLVSTDSRAMNLAVGVVVLLLAGITLLGKGFS